MMQSLVPNSFLGRWIVQLAYYVENRFPGFSMSLGQYFSIQIRGPETAEEQTGA
jgi:hypothetical protein